MIVPRRPWRLPLLRTSGVRLATAGVGLAAMGAVIVFGVIYFGAVRSLRATLDTTVTNEITEILPHGPATPAPVAARAIRAALAERPVRIVYELVSATGQHLAGDIALPPGAPGWHSLDAPDGTPFAPGVTMLRARVIALDDGARLLIGADATMIDRLDRLIRRSFLFGFGLTLGLGLIVGLAFGHRALARVDAVSVASREIMDGDFTRRIPVTGADDEFDRLAATVNTMLDRIQHLMENLRAVGDEIAHDLRSPLARLRETLELALRVPGPGRAETAIGEAIMQVDAALALCQGILRLAQIESGSRRASFAPLDLSGLLRRLSDTYEAVAEEGGHRFAASISDGLCINGDASLLNQLFANLIENALTHAGSFVDIRLDAVTANGAIIVTLADNGPGIPPDKRDVAQRRFGRLDAARHTAGHGLGLSLAAAIAQLHQARLDLTDADPGACPPGLAVTLCFAPIACPHDGG